MKQFKRVISPERVREVCINHNYFTQGTNEEYSEMLEDVSSVKVVTDEFLFELARVILNHSTEDSGDFDSICFALVNEACYMILV